MPTQAANTETAVANLALAILGQAPIATLNDNVGKAKTLKSLFGTARDAALRTNDWNFATAWVIPGLLTEPSNNAAFPNRFALPDDCLRVRFVCAQNTDPTPLPFEDWNIEAPMVNPGDMPDARMVLVMRASSSVVPPATTATIQPPLVCYTRRITSPDLWDSEFVNAFGEALAGLAAASILKDPTEAKGIREEAKKELDQVAMDNAREGAPRHVSRETSWVTARVLGVARSRAGGRY